MSRPRPVSLDPPAADPRERPLYRRDRPLYAEDLAAMDAWLDGRDRWLARELFGVGTLRGLEVTVDEARARVQVSEGVALDGAGRLICVPEPQAASLAPWLGRASPVTLYLTLRADRELVRPLPVLGGGAISDEELAPSRARDGFLLALEAESPPLPDELLQLAALRAVLDAVGEGTEGAVEAGGWPDAISSAVEATLRGETPTAIRVAPGARAALLAAAPRIWVTRVRGGAAVIDARGGSEGPILLAELRISGRGVEIDLSRRPVIVSVLALAALRGALALPKIAPVPAPPTGGAPPEPPPAEVSSEPDPTPRESAITLPIVDWVDGQPPRSPVDGLAPTDDPRTTPIPEEIVASRDGDDAASRGIEESLDRHTDTRPTRSWSMYFAWPGVPAEAGFEAIKVVGQGPASNGAWLAAVGVASDPTGYELSLRVVVGGTEPEWTVRRLTHGAARAYGTAATKVIDSGATLFELTRPERSGKPQYLEVTAARAEGGTE